jgi:hypothetical protein
MRQSVGNLARKMGMSCLSSAVACRLDRPAAWPRGVRVNGMTPAIAAWSSSTSLSEARKRLPSLRVPERTNASIAIASSIASAVGSGNSSAELGSNNAGTITTSVYAMRPSVVRYARQTWRDNVEILAAHNNVAPQMLRQIDHRNVCHWTEPQYGPSRTVG